LGSRMGRNRLKTTHAGGTIRHIAWGTKHAWDTKHASGADPQQHRGFKGYGSMQLSRDKGWLVKRRSAHTGGTGNKLRYPHSVTPMERSGRKAGNAAMRHAALPCK